MTSKRMVAVALMTVLLVFSIGSFAETYVFPVEPATLTEADISMDDAVSIAKNEMAQRQGMSLDDFQNFKIITNFVMLENGQKAWVVMLDERGYETDALVTISSVDGTIIHYQASDTEITMYLVEQWNKKKGATKTWSVEDKAMFSWLFGASDRYVAPGADHISKETARDIALSAIPQSLSSPEISYTFKLLSYTDGRPDQYVWMITFHVNGQEKYVVHVSAVDGAVVEVFSLDGNG